MPGRSTPVAHRLHPRALRFERCFDLPAHERRIKMTTVHLNEVDLPAVGSLVRAIQGDPEIARTIWKSEVTWDGAFRTSARSRDLAPIAFDEPTALGGTNTAPNPVEQIL